MLGVHQLGSISKRHKVSWKLILLSHYLQFIYQVASSYFTQTSDSGTGEPIYQNLPAHLGVQAQQQGVEQQQPDAGDEEGEMEEMKEIQHYDESVQGGCKF